MSIQPPVPPVFQALMTSSQLGQVLQATRKAHKMSQATLATRVVLSQPRVSHLEQHADELSVAQLMAWCAALGLELAIGPKGATTAALPPSDW